MFFPLWFPNDKQIQPTKKQNKNVLETHVKTIKAKKQNEKQVRGEDSPVCRDLQK